jgi:hypothetical protein
MTVSPVDPAAATVLMGLDVLAAGPLGAAESSVTC